MYVSSLSLSAKIILGENNQINDQEKKWSDTRVLQWTGKMF
jgi:hypothetical protein